MIVESRGGDRFEYNFASTGSIMQDSGVLDSVAVPYARNGIIAGDFCGVDSIIAITAGNAFTCYSTTNLKFSSRVEQSSLVLDFGVIQDLVPCDLDGEGTNNDLLIASFPTGGKTYVWVYISSQQNQNLDLSGLENPSIAQQVMNFVTSPVGFAVTTALFSSIVALPILRKKKIINL